MDTKKVFLETMNIIQSGQYISNNGNIVTIDISEMLSNTKLYRTQLKCKSDSLYQTQISICNEDTFKRILFAILACELVRYDDGSKPPVHVSETKAS